MVAIPAFLSWLFGGSGAAAGAGAAGLAGAGKAAGLAGAGKLAAGAGAAGLGGLMGAGGALGMLSNPFVAMGIGSMLPQLLGGGGGGEEQAPVDIPEGTSDRTTLPMRPIAPSPIPNADLYRPGVDPEERYFQGRFYSQGGPVMGYAGGGMLRNFANPQMMGYGPIRMQAGGIASLAEAEAGAPPEQQKALVLEAARVVKGVSQADPRMVLGQFMAAFGQEALEDLIRRVESGEMDQMIEGQAGMIEGNGDGMSDQIPGTIDGQQDVLLSDGEFVIPADVVSGLGNGSSDAGARQLEEMMAKVRASRTGTESQAPQIDPQRAMPV